MSRSLLLVVLAAALSSCAPAHYGYAPNLRPSLAQLAAGADDPDNPFRSAATAGSAGEMQ